jgi:hypothetical protein
MIASASFAVVFEHLENFGAPNRAQGDTLGIGHHDGKEPTFHPQFSPQAVPAELLLFGKELQCGFRFFPGWLALRLLVLVLIPGFIIRIPLGGESGGKKLPDYRKDLSRLHFHPLNCSSAPLAEN